MKSSLNSHGNELNKEIYTLEEMCDIVGISTATGLNWVRLGKIRPLGTADGHSQYVFDKNYVHQLVKDIDQNKNTALKSRRNKKFVSGSNNYKSYIDDNSPNQDIVDAIFENCLINGSQEISDTALGDILMHYAHLLLSKRGATSKLKELLLSDLNACFKKMPNSSDRAESIDKALLPDIAFVPHEDTLGYIYISLQNLRRRKATGAYYTPNRIVKKLISKLDMTDKKLLDPCCGCGNFLLQIDDSIELANIHAFDIDPVGIAITRINLALKYGLTNIDDYEILCSNIKKKDFLSFSSKEKYDLILGNPPWGYDFTSHQILSLCKKYECCSKRSHESYDLFLENSIRHLSSSGSVSFILPEAILDVKNHIKIRRFILDKAYISSLSYLGEVFSNVQCPSIILNLSQNKPSNIQIEKDGTAFSIDASRPIAASNFNILSTDKEYEILAKMNNLPGMFTLKGNCDFALGIVSGGNKGLLYDIQVAGSEPILRGSDISEYKCSAPRKYTYYKPELFQQIAPEKMYHNPEKLLYRFIASYPVVARDTNGYLTLNSCNIMIPQKKDISAEYIMAVLNSDAVRFYFTHSWKTLKILRSHLESIPIPDPGNDQETIISLVRKIEKSPKHECLELLAELNNVINRLYGIS
ncbi:MAG: hypothetical protein E7309_06215 [Butyrivibrio sp.]|nr:hypothetical protein [Butyrivibrio sp.]